MEELIMEGYNKFSNATEDKIFLTEYYNNLVQTSNFKKALQEGLKKGGRHHQQFEGEISKSWATYMVETGRSTPTKEKVLSKWGMAADAFNILEKIKDDKYAFKIINADKHVGAIKYGDIYFEVSITQHKQPQNPNGDVIVANKLNSFIQELADGLSELYSLVVIKNNQITVETNEQKQLSVKITKKKQKLF